MVSGGFDKRAIVWKIPQETQLVFKERNYSLDCVTAINQFTFVTGSQDGEISMWNVEKVKPVCSVKGAHSSGWVSALGGIYNTDMLVSGGMDDKLQFYKVDPENKLIEKVFNVRCVEFDHLGRSSQRYTV